MNEELTSAKLKASERRVDAQLAEALGRARAYLEKKVVYKWGGKTEDALDCSGFVAECYPTLYEGAEKQYDQLRDWLFKDDERFFVEPGDLVFFARVDSPAKIRHVGIAERVDGETVHVIHSSERRGGVVTDEFDLSKNIFRESYFAVAVGKMRPFLFRRFLAEEIMKECRG